MNPRVERIRRRCDIDPRVCGFVCLYGECFGAFDSTSDTLNPRFDIGYAQPSDSRRTVGSMSDECFGVGLLKIKLINFNKIN